MPLYDEYMQRLQILDQLRPKSTGRTALTIVFFIIFLIAVAFWFTPWVQTAQAFGTVSTLRAENRTQAISALVPGQIKEWHVQEGERVKKGQALVTLADQDKNLVSRLEQELMAKERQRDAISLALKAAQQDLDRKESLLKQGIVSVRDRDNAQIKVQETKTSLASAEAEVNQAQTKLARQSTQTKYAPADGVVTRLRSSGLATAVRSGDMLASFIPDDVERAVVLEINGLDAPFVKPGRKVRLQFDGWPVIQFSGWPAVAVGTFAGEVEFIEPVATESGRFRVWVKEDKTTGETPWPKADYVRLGSRARGWVLLQEVKLGYEIWRQLNNFPPVYSASHGAASEVTSAE